MTHTTTHRAGQMPSVGMGQILFARGPDRMQAVLGSCIGLAIFDPQTKSAALAHVVLPRRGSHSGTPGKFADTAVPHIVQWFVEQKIPASRLVAKIAGGASMFGSKGAMQIGQNNADTIEELLGATGIKIVGRHLGGNKGRRVRLDCQSGELAVEIAGETPIRL